MARPGPAPSANPQRRNAAPEVVELPLEGYRGPYPKLPTTYTLTHWDNAAQRWVDGRRKFLASTRAYYLTWARSPQATLFTAVTWPVLGRLAVLVDRFDRGDASVAAEIRQIEAKLGATYEDMAKLRLRIAAAPADGKTDDKAKTSPRRRAPDPRRRHLAAVPG